MKRFYLLIIPLLLQSCSSMYIPSVRSIPLLDKKGEFQGEAGASNNSVYANGNYAFTDDIAVSLSGNLSYRNFTDYYDIGTHKDDQSSSRGSFIVIEIPRGSFAHRYGEVSVGKINMLPTTKQKLEVFGGVGMGKATDVDNDYQYSYKAKNYKANYYSFFGQGNYGIVKHRIVEVGVSLRLAYSIFNYTANLYGSSVYKNRFDAFHAEPMAVARVGNENFKFVFRVGTNLTFAPIDAKEELAAYRGFTDDGYLDYTTLHISIGISRRIAGK